MVGLVKNPFGVLPVCLTQYRLSRFAPPLFVPGTTISHRPVASEVQVGSPDIGLPDVSLWNRPRDTPASGATPPFAIRSLPTWTWITVVVEVGATRSTGGRGDGLGNGLPRTLGRGLGGSLGSAVAGGSDGITLASGEASGTSDVGSAVGGAVGCSVGGAVATPVGAAVGGGLGG
jgi:hypothetical protein